MSLKKATREILEYIPKCERNEDVKNPTIIHYRTLTKAGHDNWVDAGIRTKTTRKRSQIISDSAQASAMLIKSTVVKLENVISDDGKLVTMEDKSQIAAFLMGMGDIETINEIMDVLSGESLLDEDEAKN